MNELIVSELRRTYDIVAEERDRSEIGAWKAEERQRFLAELQREGKRTLLEIGSGPGRDGQFFQAHGLQVVCLDLSPKMVELCQAKGLEAHVMDVRNLDFQAQRFDSVFALNSLLHIPKADMEQVLLGIQKLLVPAGLFYLGVYGGKDSEDIWLEDRYEPKRFFSFFTDQALLTLVTRFFELVYFRQVRFKEKGEYHFQSLILRKNA